VRGHGWHPPWRAIVAAATVAALGVPSRAEASDEVEILPGATIYAVVADLDDDGAREIVRIVEAEANATAVEAWRHAPEGWQRAGRAAFVSPDEIGNTTLADRALGAGALLVVRREGRERVLALTAQGLPGDQFGRVCCLALAEVRLRGDRDMVLEPLAGEGLDRSAAQLQAVDLDGDGTDELATLALEVDEDDAPLATRLGVLAWRDGGFVSIGEVTGPADLYGAWPGDTNGLVGSELHFGTAEFGNLTRVALVDRELAVDEGHVEVGESGGWVAGIADGAIVLSTQSGVRIVRWPSGGEPWEAGRLPLSPHPWVTVVGTGRDALLVHQDDTFGSGPPSFAIYDLDRRRLGEVAAAADTRGVWQLLNRSAGAGLPRDRYLYPYVGPLPDGSFGRRAAFATSGVAIVQDGDGGFERRSISELAGLAPIGVVGPADGWLALGEGVGSGTTAYLAVGGLVAFGPGRLLVGPMDGVLAAEAAPAVSVELRGAVDSGSDPDADRLLAGPDGFEVVVTAPPGSLVLRDGALAAQDALADEPVVIDIRPRGAGNGNRDFEASLAVFTPDGRTTQVELRGTFVREMPELTAGAETATFALATRVLGAASPGTIVTIDGRPIDVASGGAFDVLVDASIWPEDVVVTARDPLGNETTRRLQVVGFVDYRGLPWLPIVGAVTVGAGAYAVLRTPGRRRQATTAGTGEGTLEEIDAE
jgi:hypothetical protein